MINLVISLYPEIWCAAASRRELEVSALCYANAFDSPVKARTLGIQVIHFLLRALFEF